MLTLFVLAIPLFNLVMYIIWAVSEDGDEGRRNYCRAAIAWVLIAGIIWMFFAFLFVGAAAVSTI